MWIQKDRFEKIKKSIVMKGFDSSSEKERLLEKYLIWQVKK
ncbi:MAG: hypothetical protein ACLT2Z_08755 [Eubacterium sp.]